MNSLLMVIIGLDIAGGGSLAGFAIVRWRRGVRWTADLETYELRFPRGLDADDVTAFFRGVAGIVPARWERSIAVRAVALEVSATAAGIRHYLLVPRPQAGTVLAALRAALPGVTSTPDTTYVSFGAVRAASLGLTDRRRLLAVDRSTEVSRAILASLQPLRDGERIVRQWIIRPTGPAPAVPVSSSRQGNRPFIERVLAAMTTGRELDGENLRAARAKAAGPLFGAVGRVGTVASDAGRARQLLAQVLAAHHAANAPGVHLYRRHLPDGPVASALRDRRLPAAVYPCSLSAVELAAVAAFPLGDVSLPGLQLAGTRQLAPSADIPRTGRIVATATFPGSERPLALSVPDSLRHLHVLGPTGVGKSTLLVGLIAQDMAAGRGVVVLDPKGDLVADVLDRVPTHRTHDVIVLDPTDEERPVGLNLLAGAGNAPELVADQVVAIFHQMYRAFWGPRTDDIMRAALLTLAQAPGMTLCEVPLLLTDPAFRRRLVGRLDDPLGLGPFWGWYESLSDGERTQAIGPVLNKLRPFLMRRRLRNVLGQASPRLDFGHVLAERRILLVPLTKGLLGEEAAALVGSLVVARLWQAVQRRAGLPGEQRHPTFAFVDEFQDYLHLPTDIADVLAQARGLGLGLTLAHQHLGQLPDKLEAAILANARSRVIFQVSADDGRTLARELTPHLQASDLQGLDAHHVVLTLSAGARVAPPVTAVTSLPPAATGQAGLARQYSRERYGADRAEVEAAIKERHFGRPPGGSVGRREVSS